MNTSSALPVPLTVVGGFLGAGKSSLLTHLLTARHGRRLAVLVNDFGEVNVDANLIASVHGETISLSNGCVCCTIRDDLVRAVVDLLRRDPAPEHIIVETSGVSKPLVVVQSFVDDAARGLVDVQHLIVVLDAVLACDAGNEYWHLAIEQIELADLVVINKTDLVSPPELDALQRRICARSPQSRVLATAFGVVPLGLIFGEIPRTGTARVAAAGADPVHDVDGQFATWVYRSARAWSFMELQRAVDRLPGEIYRAKGVVRLDLDTGECGIFQLTGRRSWMRLHRLRAEETDATELVFIGKPGTVTNASIDAIFESAVSAHAESRRAGTGYVVGDLRAFEVIFE